MGTYLVTGGCGFIGSHLVDQLLALNHQVIVIDNLSTGDPKQLSKKAHLVVDDIANQDLLYSLLGQVDGCFHLAALLGITLSQDDWIGTNHVNLVGTLNVFNAAARHFKANKKKIPVVYASSCAVYGDSPVLSLTETTAALPLSGYAADKLACELHARVATWVHQVPTIGLRFFNVYGPRQNPESPYSGVMSIFVDHIRQGKPIDIFGDGEQTRDFVYVADVVDHLIFFMHHPELAPAVINVCTGQTTTLNQLIDRLVSTIGTGVKKNYLPPRAGDALHSCGNPEQAIRLGIKAKYSLKDGIEKLLVFGI